MKKRMFFIYIVLAMLLVSCKPNDEIGDSIDVYIDVEDKVTTYVNEPFQLEYTTNDEKGLIFESQDEDLFTVDNNGVITGLKKGQAFLKVNSKSSSLFKFVFVSVENERYINVLSEVSLDVGETKLLEVETNVLGGLNFTVKDSSIATVDSNGNVKALKEGVTEVVVSAKDDEKLKKVVVINVLEATLILVEETEISLETNKTYSLAVTTDIPLGVSYVSSNENILTVSNKGVITAINPGEAVVKIVSNKDENNYKEVNVVITLPLDLVLEKRLEKKETYSLEGIINNPVYESKDVDIVKVSEEGLIEGVNPGYTQVIISNKNDSSIFVEFDVYVLTAPEVVTVVGEDKMLVGQDQDLSLDVFPIYGDNSAFYQSLNESVLQVSLDGNVKAVGVGSAGVRVTPLGDSSLSQTFYITVSSIMVVNGDAKEGDVIEYDGFSLLYGETLFSKIDDAVKKATALTDIIVFPGVYKELLIINKEVNLHANNATIEGNIIVQSNNVTIDGFTIKDGNITNVGSVNNVEILNNNFTNFDGGTVISLDGVSNVNVSYNEIVLNSDLAILVSGFNKGNNIIKGNIIDGVKTGIKVESNKDYHIDTTFELIWNEIKNTKIALSVDLGNGNNINSIRQIVRFNKVYNYELALVANNNHSLDLNLNYWGNDGPKIADFVNVLGSELAAFYINKEEIIKEEDYDPRVPVKIEIVNKIDEIEVGEEYTIEFNIYPRELKDNTVRWHYSNVTVVETDGATIKAVESWDITVTLRARDDVNVYDSFELSITTDPHIRFLPENHTYADFYVGNNIKFNLSVVPYQIRDENIIYESSDDSVAVVTEGGIVNLLGAGDALIEAYLEMDPTVRQEFQIKVFDEIDLNDPFDFAISSMVNYSVFRSWEVYGVNFNYRAEELDSVSRLLIDDIEIDKSMMIPSEYAPIRPGAAAPRLKPNLPEDQIYNDEYVQYVVVHETGNTDVGAGAYWHALYLMNGYTNGTDRYASWHFTVDDKKIYQHIPTDEVSYHAGDGASVAGSPWQDGNTGGIGGGNRNGIGIETSVAHGDDVVVTWHKTARLAAKLSKQYNLPGNRHLDNVKFHNDFSGKMCPQSILRGGLVEFFYGLVEHEYYREYNFPGLTLSINSHNTEYLANNGRIIKRPLTPTIVSYDLTMTYKGETKTETLYVYIPGEIK